MRYFHVADLSAGGDLRAKAEYAYPHLEQVPGAGELIAELASELYRSPEEFEHVLDGQSAMTYRWKSIAAGAGISTLRHDGELVSLGLLASGLNSDSDQITLQAFQAHLLRELRDTPHEPGFDLMTLPQRPLLVSVGFGQPRATRDQLIAALADRCFAAAYFRCLGLA